MQNGSPLAEINQYRERKPRGCVMLKELTGMDRMNRIKTNAE
jgi:hypothetical protein